MRFGAFWQVPGYEGSSVARRHWETIEEIALAEQLGFESASASALWPRKPRCIIPCISPLRAPRAIF
jgi:hypothetical protein